MAVAPDTTGSTLITAGATSASVDITAAAVGAWCYLWCVISTGSTTQTGVPSNASWTTLSSAQTAAGTAGQTIGIYRRQKQSGDTTFSFSWTTSGKGEFSWSSYTGLNNATPDEQSAVILNDTTSRAAIPTPTATPTGSGEWALTFYGQKSTTSTNKPTAWTPDAALTERKEADNSAAASSPWLGSDIEDSNGVVAVAAQSYTATSNQTESHDGSGILFLIPATQTQSISFNANPGRTWRRRFNVPERQTPRQPAIGSIQPPYSPPVQRANPGKTWNRRYNYPEHLTIPVNQKSFSANVPGLASAVNVVSSFGSLYTAEQLPQPQIQAGRTWRRRFNRHQVRPYLSAPNASVTEITAAVSVTANFGNVIEQIPLPATRANPGKTWRRRFNLPEHLTPFWNGSTSSGPVGITGLVASVNVQASFGNVIEQIPLPPKPVSPGRTWSRRYKRHQVLPYKSAANANVLGLVSSVSVLSNFGVAKEFITESNANVNVIASLGTVATPVFLPINMIKPGKVWKRRFVRHQAQPLTSAPNIKFTGLTAAVNVVSNFGAIKESATETTANVNVASNFGAVVFPIPLPSQQVKPGSTWKRKFRRHQILPLRPAPIVTTQGLAASVTAQSQFGIVKNAITVSTAHVNVAAINGTPKISTSFTVNDFVASHFGAVKEFVSVNVSQVNTVANFGGFAKIAPSYIAPVNPGRTWRRKFRKPVHQVFPYKAFNPGVVILGVTATVVAVTPSGYQSIYYPVYPGLMDIISVSIPTANIKITSAVGSFSYKIPVLKWRAKLLKSSSGRVYNNTRNYYQ